MLLISVLGENSEDLYEFLHNLRHWGVRDLFESPLLDSVLEHVRRHFYQLFYDQRREKSAPQYTAGFSLEHDKEEQRKRRSAAANHGWFCEHV